jgi:hypothetical protein
MLPFSLPSTHNSSSQTHSNLVSLPLNIQVYPTTPLSIPPMCLTPTSIICPAPTPTTQATPPHSPTFDLSLLAHAITHSPATEVQPLSHHQEDHMVASSMPPSPKELLVALHQMQTRSKNNIQKPKQFTDGTIPYPPPKALITKSVVVKTTRMYTQ